ncbi:hypothetical protein TSUD_418250, partial [Trifolium subterraneum]
GHAPPSAKSSRCDDSFIPPRPTASGAQALLAKVSQSEQQQQLPYRNPYRGQYLNSSSYQQEDDATSQMLNLGASMTSGSHHHPLVGMFGEMVFAGVFGNSPNSYQQAGRVLFWAGYGVIKLLVNLATLIALDLRVTGRQQELYLVYNTSILKLTRVRNSCGEKVTARGKGKKYPDGFSDMAFSLFVKNSKGQVAQGYSSPLFVGDQIYDAQTYGVPFVLTNGNLKAHGFQYISSLNVSYTITLNPSPDFKFGSQVNATEIKINAEGLYNRNTGVMCLVGCWHLRTNDKILIKNESLDCEIMVNVQFPPMNSKGGLQLFHVKKNSEVLPHISIVMLLVITLGHMIPLMLNFEALFKVNHNSVPDAFIGSRGWLEANEVIVRMVTMVAFLLELRLVQLTWSSRQGEESQISLWASEKKILYMTLPLYFGGGLTAWLVHIWKNSSQRSSQLHLSRHRSKFPLVGQHSYQGPPLWEDFKSYAGLLLDGFLLPQILFNIFSNSGEKALATSFYFGTTIVRILPHAYDLYRTHSSSWYLDMLYIYADHRKDFYSTAWDIIIPIGALLLAFLVYFQQRFGSRCFLPKRFRETSSYEKVPVIGNDDL